MNQILVTEKVIVTPEYRKKKKVYKFNFFLSIFLACTLFSCYIYAEYDRNKSEQVSQEILASLEQTQVIDEQQDNTTVSIDNNILVVTLAEENEAQSSVVDVTGMLSDEEERENSTNNDENNSSSSDSGNNSINSNNSNSGNNSNSNNSSSNNKQNTIAKSIASDGTEYYTDSILKIDKIGIEYPVLSDTSDELLKISLNKLWGKNGPNEVGNYVIIGHNYKSGKMFGKLSQIEIGDTFTLQDNSGRTLTYQVYDIYVVDPEDTSCTSQHTNGKKEVTLITCKNSGKQRLVVKAEEA